MNPRFFFAVAIVTAALATCAISGQQTAKPNQPLPGAKATTTWTPELIMQLKKVGGVQVSPDGKQAVYVVTSAVMAGDKSEFVSQIYLADTDGNNSRQLTYANKSSDSPQWSPDGQWLAFALMRSGKRNLWLLRLSGGEAEQLTDAKTGVAGFKRAARWQVPCLHHVRRPTPVEEKNTKQKNDPRVIDENVKQVRLYLLPIAKDDKGQRKQRLLTKANYSVGFLLGATAFDWSPDSKTIAFTHTPTPSPNDWPKADISLVDVASGKIKKFAHSAAAEAMPLFSPDGKHLAFVASDQPPSWRFKLGVRSTSCGWAAGGVGQDV